MTNIKETISEIEHLSYDKRKPEHISIFESKSSLSKFVWDIYAHNACVLYKKNNPEHKKTILSQKGFFLGNLSEEDAKLLQEIFNSCKKKEFDPHDFDSSYTYEPRKNLHEHMARINDYFEPSEFLFKNLPKILEPLSPIIERECGYYWKVASLRIFQVKPVEYTHGFHKDGQPVATKKIFFFPNGVNKEIGSTQIITKDEGKELVVEGSPGTWMIFENNEIEHQAFSSINITSRPTIEIDIMPSFETDPTIIYTGVNSWHPWFPIDSRNKNVVLSTEQLNFDNVQQRTLERVAGLSTTYKFDNYRFSDFLEMDYESFFERIENEGNDSSKIDNVENKQSNDANVAQSNDDMDTLKNNFKEIFRQFAGNYGITKTIRKSTSLIIRLFFEQLKPKTKSPQKEEISKSNNIY